MTVVLLINIFVYLIKSQLINRALNFSIQKLFWISFFNLNEDIKIHTFQTTFLNVISGNIYIISAI